MREAVVLHSSTLPMPINNKETCTSLTITPRAVTPTIQISSSRNHLTISPFQFKLRQFSASHHALHPASPTKRVMSALPSGIDTARLSSHSPGCPVWGIDSLPRRAMPHTPDMSNCEKKEKLPGDDDTYNSICSDSKILLTSFEILWIGSCCFD